MGDSIRNLAPGQTLFPVAGPSHAPAQKTPSRSPSPIVPLSFTQPSPLPKPRATQKRARADEDNQEHSETEAMIKQRTVAKMALFQMAMKRRASEPYLRQQAELAAAAKIVKESGPTPLVETLAKTHISKPPAKKGALKKMTEEPAKDSDKAKKAKVKAKAKPAPEQSALGEPSSKHKKNKGKGKAKEVEEQVHAPPANQDTTTPEEKSDGAGASDDESQVFTIPLKRDEILEKRRKAETTAPEPWILSSTLIGRPESFYDAYDGPFTNILKGGSIKENPVERIISKSKYPVLAAAWGKIASEEKRNAILAAATMLSPSEPPAVTVIGDRNVWVLLSCKSEEIRTRLLAESAVFHTPTGQLVFFRRYRSKPHQQRVLAVDHIPETKDSEVLGEIKSATGAETVEVLGKSREAVLVKVTLTKESRDLYSPPTQITIGKKKGRENIVVRKAPHCVGCHSEDHYASECPWKKVKAVKLKNEQT